jgi:hypothetical protein
METIAGNNTTQFSKLGDKLKLEFDYEINSIKLDTNEELSSKMYYYDKTEREYSKLTFT